MADVILTSDKTMMSDFHLNYHLATPFYGHGDVFPPWLFRLLIRKPTSDKGVVKFAPYPLRKVEGKLLDGNFDVLTVSPHHLKKYLINAKILGIHTVNPLGNTFKPSVHEILKVNPLNEDYSAIFFREIVQNKYVISARKRGLKIIVGGAGASQFEQKPELIERMNIDCVIIGEAEVVIGDVIKSLLDGKEIPRIINSYNNGGVPTIDQISDIKNASVYGCVEIGRGCSRGCKFCDQAKWGLRWLPLEKIEKELIVNRDAGLTYGLLHAEDILLYGQRTLVPDAEKLTRLFKLAKRYYDIFHVTHLSQAAVSANEKAFTQAMEIVRENQDFMLGETGIETGSMSLLERTMPAKSKPFATKEWPEIVSNSMGIMHDNKFIPYCSFILGFPSEKESDILSTIDLMDDLKGCMSLFVVINFFPLGSMSKNNGKITNLDELTELEKEVIKKASQHNVRWFDDYTRLFLKGAQYEEIYYRLFQRWKSRFIRLSKKRGLI